MVTEDANTTSLILAMSDTPSPRPISHIDGNGRDDMRFLSMSFVRYCPASISRQRKHKTNLRGYCYPNREKLRRLTPRYPSVLGLVI